MPGFPVSADALLHTCTRCAKAYSLPTLPTAGQRLAESSRGHIAFGEYVYAHCPHCGQRDWATPRRFLGFLGPRSFYALALFVVLGFIGFATYLGFFFHV